MFRIGKIAFAFVAIFALLSDAKAQQEKPVHLKLSHWLPPTHPLHKAWTEWAESIKRASNGSITYSLFSAEQLGKAMDDYDMARDGIADFAFVNAGYQPGRFPIAAAGELPFLFSNAKDGTAAVDIWYRKYAAKEMKGVHFCFAWIIDPGTFFSTTPIVTPEDMRGKKVRPSNGTTASFVTLLGGTNIAASAPATRDLLEKGVADATTSPWRSSLLFGYQKAAKYAVDMKAITSVLVWVMNAGTYDRLSDLQRKVIDDHCNTDSAVKLASPWADYESEGYELFKNTPGTHVTSLTADQLIKWKMAAEPLSKEWAETLTKNGQNPEPILAELVQLIREHKAGN